jgi:hypothetical protein
MLDAQIGCAGCSVTACMQTKPVLTQFDYKQEQEICRMCTVGPLPGGTEAGSVILLSISLYETEEQIFLLLFSCAMAACSFRTQPARNDARIQVLKRCC